MLAQRWRDWLSRLSDEQRRDFAKLFHESHYYGTIILARFSEAQRDRE